MQVILGLFALLIFLGVQIVKTGEKGLGILLIVLTVLMFLAFIAYVIVWNVRHWWREQQEAIERSNAEYQEYLRKLELRNTPEYILTHQPSRGQIQTILDTVSDPAIREMAIETALSSGDRWIISVLQSHLPEEDHRDLMAYLEVDFAEASDEECEALLKQYHGWELLSDPLGAWWRSWESELRAGANRAIAERERIARLHRAEADGRDVCWECGTIDPPRCHWSGCDKCLSGKTPCTSEYNGYCYFHDTIYDD